MKGFEKTKQNKVKKEKKTATGTKINGRENDRQDKGNPACTAPVCVKNKMF